MKKKGVVGWGSVRVCSRNELKTYSERRASFLLQSIPRQQDDVTALAYPWCFAGKMNEVGHAEGVNEDMRAHTCGSSVFQTCRVIHTQHSAQGGE